MTVNDADQYFANRLNSSPWDNVSDPDKTKALNMAQNDLALYENQVDYTRYNNAICEQAIWLLQGDSRAELQQNGVKSMSLGKMSEQYQLNGRDPMIAPKAWQYIKGPSIKAGGLR